MTVAGRIGAAWVAWGATALLAWCSAGCSSGEALAVDAGTTREPVLDAGGPGGEAAVPPDGKALCPTGPCNFQTGEGCGANMTCAPSSADGKSPTCESAGSTSLGGGLATPAPRTPRPRLARRLFRKGCFGPGLERRTPGQYMPRPPAD